MLARLGAASAAVFARRDVYALFLAGAFLATVGFAVLGLIVKPNPWKLLDWLIAYPDAFVRRGLFGEIFFAVSGATGLPADWLVLAVQLLAYAALFLGLWRIFSASADRVPGLLLFYAPFLALYQVGDWVGGYRKEILFLGLLALLAAALARTPRGDARAEARLAGATVLALALAPALALGHELLALYVPYLLVPLVAAGPSPWRIALAALLVAASGAAFLAAALNPGDAETARAICAEIREKAPPSPPIAVCETQDNPIVWLARSASDGMKAVAFDLRYLLVGLLPALALSAAGFWPLRAKLAALPRAERRALAAAVGLSVAATLPVFAVAVDWGRFLYIHAASAAVLALALAARVGAEAPDPEPVRRFPARALIGLLVPLYALGWSLFHKQYLVAHGVPATIAIRVIEGPAPQLPFEPLPNPLAPPPSLR